MKQRTSAPSPFDANLSARDRILFEAARLLDPQGFEDDKPDDVLESMEQCKSLHHFFRESWVYIPSEQKIPFVDGWSIGCLAEHLQALTDGQLLKLVINMPPRHTKSVGACVIWPAWWWTKQPHARFMYASYSDAFSWRDSQATQDLIRTRWYQERWGHLFKLKEQTKGRVTNDQGGHRLAISIKGRGMGEGADALVGDDLHKPTDVYSAPSREQVIRFWTETMAGRVQDFENTRRLLIHQRTHPADVSGYVLAREIGYECLCLPFRAEPKRIFFTMGAAHDANAKYPIVLTSLQTERPELQDDREEGERLHPERYTEAGAKEFESNFEARGKAGQLQQRPASEQGQMFSSIHFQLCQQEGKRVVFGYDDPELKKKALRCSLADFLWFQTIDTAMKDDPGNAYTVIGTYGIAPIGIKVKDIQMRFLVTWSVFRERLTVPDQWEAIKELAHGEAIWDPEEKKFKVKGSQRPWPGPLALRAIEPKASGLGLLAQAKLESVPLLPLEGPEFQGSKEQRAVTLSILYQQGLVWHRAGMPGLAIYESELQEFPRTEFKDQVDVASYAAILFQKNSVLASLRDAASSSVSSSIIEQSLAEQEAVDARKRGMREGNVRMGSIILPQQYLEDWDN